MLLGIRVGQVEMSRANLQPAAHRGSPPHMPEVRHSSSHCPDTSATTSSSSLQQLLPLATTGHIDATLKGLLDMEALAGHIYYIGTRAHVLTGAAGMAMHPFHWGWAWPVPLPSTHPHLNKIKQF